MEYKIHHLHLIEPANEQPFFEEEVQKRTSDLQKLLRHHSKESILEIYIRKEGDHEYNIIAYLNLKDNPVFAKEKGSKAVIVVNNALYKLKNMLKQEKLRDRNEYLRKRKNRFHAAAETTMPELKTHLTNDDRPSFTRLLIKILPEIQVYIKNQVIKKPGLLQLLKRRILSINDIVDEVYAGLYQELQSDATITEKFELWAFALADHEIDKLDEKYSHEFRDQISVEELNNKELQEMQEELTANADFKPVLTEELDESWFYPGEYDVGEILTDAGADEEIIKHVEENEMNIAPLLSDLSEQQRSVFEWYYMYHLDLNEIASVKNVHETKVIQWLKDARAHLVSLLREHA